MDSDKEIDNLLKYLFCFISSSNSLIFDSNLFISSDIGFK